MYRVTVWKDGVGHVSTPNGDGPRVYDDVKRLVFDEDDGLTIKTWGGGKARFTIDEFRDFEFEFKGVCHD